MKTTPEEDRIREREKEDEARSRTIRFQCRPGLACFNTCCEDVNIFLSPYDILRIKNCLKIPSFSFLEQHTRTLLPGPGKIPIIQLKMREEDNRCSFVTQDGCSIYEDRPWACRMYPLDKSEETGEYDFIVDADRCLGQKEPKEWVIQEWFLDQRLSPYEVMDERFKIVTQYPRLGEAGIDHPQVQKMFRMASYDLDTFRRFVFETKFLEMFDLEENIVETVKNDDVALLDLALRWVRFGLVCGDTLPIKEELMKKGRESNPQQAEKPKKKGGGRKKGKNKEQQER